MKLFTEEEQLQIRRAVESAETNTSGEIRVCVEKTCSEDVLDRAANYFYRLEMDKTKLRNGVLIYLATVDRKFAIIGDAGINAVVPPDFWDSAKECMLEQFKHGQLIEGIVEGVKMAGKQLKKFFPYAKGDKNELPDDVAFMDGE
ncbi:TPM domain-containing protein [Mucilaginibacter myungsuensis]|uniref:TPM domain-containing protein n=1 Tax=Mucilaginibacter myungsuensis TaxID=649104 RepID=A0A929PW43_9SPHI|nr:TPM domain-containing protein [Mucilaginibacter myungsuensis]MBE9661686.1 TPM domain-containing protein [Mucilaginibacter myungsuensis]MDN3597830.1 TPM domain-containing protein [Mucilaginibacter myungsuensis]